MANYLIVVEGQSLELKFFESLFARCLPEYSLDPRVYNKANQEELKITTSGNSGDNTIYIIKPKHNSLSEIVRGLKNDPDVYAFAEFFSEERPDPDFFEKVFLIFDIDETSAQDLRFAMSFFNDEYGQGLLLLSSPSIEALGDKNRSFLLPIGQSINSTYKPMVRSQLVLQRKIRPNGKIADYFHSSGVSLLQRAFLENRILFGTDKAFMEHPDCFGKMCLPEALSNGTRYPHVCSLVYVLLGSLFRLDLQISPNEALLDKFRQLSSKEPST